MDQAGAFVFAVTGHGLNGRNRIVVLNCANPANTTDTANLHSDRFIRFIDRIHNRWDGDGKLGHAGRHGDGAVAVVGYPRTKRNTGPVKVILTGRAQRHIKGKGGRCAGGVT